MKLLHLLALGAITLLGCAEEETPVPAETPLPFAFSDGFESANNDLDDLFPADGSRWSNLQRESPGAEENTITLDDVIRSEGQRALKLTAAPSGATVSKMNIEKAGFFAPVGSLVEIRGDFYISSAGNLENLFLIDLECCSCWDPGVPNNQCPGVRLKLSDPQGYPSIERGKILGRTLSHTGFPFPKDEWVRVVWRMRLSPNGEGENVLEINDRVVLDTRGKNLPNADEFRAEFAANDINFTLGDPLGYERIQIGATANSSNDAVGVWVDDFSLTIEE